jgi:hypothetical protein
LNNARLTPATQTRIIAQVAGSEVAAAALFSDGAAFPNPVQATLCPAVNECSEFLGALPAGVFGADISDIMDPAAEAPTSMVWALDGVAAAINAATAPTPTTDLTIAESMQNSDFANKLIFELPLQERLRVGAGSKRAP